VATVYLSVFPQDKAKEILEAVKSNAKTIKHDLSQRVLAIEKSPIGILY
jgi:ribosome-binding factor A